MKNIFCIIISIFLSLLVNAQVSLPISNNFEGSAPFEGGWTMTHTGNKGWGVNKGGYKPPSVSYGSPASAYDGLFNAFVQTNTVGHTALLVTPTIDMTKVNKPIIEFYEARVSRINADVLRVFYRIDPQSEWQQAAEYLDESNNWTRRQIILPFTENPSLKTNTFQIGFQATSQSGYGVCIDNVYIYESEKLSLMVDNVSAKSVDSDKAKIASGTTLNPIGYIYVKVKGNDGELILNSASVTCISNNNDITRMRLFATTEPFFRKSQNLGASTSPDNEFSFSGINHKLSSGDNYIWITVDTHMDVVHNSELRFTIPVNSLLIGSNMYPPSVIVPSGFTTIEKSIAVYDFEDDDGWQLDASEIWQIDWPMGGGKGDPTESYDGNKALVTNNDGNYPIDVTVPIHATSENINAKYYKDIRTHFKRWLNTGYQTNMTLSVSPNNKAAWLNIYDNYNAAVQDNNWVNIRLNTGVSRADSLSARFSIEKTSSSAPYGGWNIDNFAITGEFIHSDVGATKLITPIQTCGLTNAEEVKVKLRNFGGATVSGPFDIGYSINGANYERESYTSSIDSEVENIYTFAKKADFSTPGLKTLKIRTFLEGDQDAGNDLFETKMYVFPTVAYPYQTSFESNNAYWYPSGTKSSWAWGVPAGTIINKASQGNRAWATSLSNDYNHNEKSYLESPCFDLSVSVMPVISFDYMMQMPEGEVDLGDDGLTLQYSIDGGNAWAILPKDVNLAYNWFDTDSVTALATSGWSKSTTEYVTAKTLLPSDAIRINGVKFRFVFGSDANTRKEGVALDMIRVYELSYDVGISALVSPTTACEIGRDVPLELKLKNYEYKSIPKDTEIPIAIQVNGGKIITETITIPNALAKGSEYSFLTSNTFNLFSAGNYEIVAYTTLNPDEDHSNDTLTTTVTVHGMPEYTLGPDIGVINASFTQTLDAGQGYSTYEWFKLPDKYVNIGESQTTVVSDEGTYMVKISRKISDDLTCYAQDDITIKVTDKDVSVQSINNLASACERLDPIQPEITILSNSTSPFTEGETIPLVVEVDGEIKFQESYTVPEGGWGASGNTHTYKFTNELDLQEYKTYSISIYTALDDDFDRSNDRKDIETTTYGVPTVSIFARTSLLPEVYEEVNEIITTSADTLQLKASEGFETYTWEYQSYGQSNWITTGVSSQLYKPTLKNSRNYRVTVTDDLNSCGDAQATVFVNAFDLSISAINSPMPEFCDNGEETPLKITIKNVGADVISAETQILLTANTSISTLNNTITLTEPLSVGGTIEHEFTEKILFSIGETFVSYSIKSSIDPNPDNDELSITTTKKPSPWVTIDPNVLYKVFYSGDTCSIRPKYSDDVTSVLWQDGVTEEIYTIYGTPNSQFYKVTVENNSNCKDSASMEIITTDIAISEIIEPKTVCEFQNNSPVKLTLLNNGNTPYAEGTVFSIDLYLDGLKQVTETITLSSVLKSKESKQFTLNHTLNLFGYENATIQINISSDGEEVINDNNSLNKSIYAPGYPIPYIGEDRTIYGWEEDIDPGLYFSYRWQDGTTDRILTATATGEYSLDVTDYYNCSGEASVYLTFLKDDIELLQVLSPKSGCDLANEPIKYRIKNNGNYDIPVGRKINLKFSINGVAQLPVPEIYTLTEAIAPGAVFDVTLEKTIDLSNLGVDTKSFSLLFEVDMVEVVIDEDNTIKDGKKENNMKLLTLKSYPRVDFNMNVATGIKSKIPLILEANKTYTAYQWKFNDGNISGANKQTHTATQTGKYSVDVVDGNGCTGSASVNVTILKPDYGISKIINPASSCELVDNQTVTVELSNFGDDKLERDSIISVTLWLNGNEQAKEVFTLTQDLNPNNSINLTFGSKIDLSSDTHHIISAEAVHPLDVNSSNNRLDVTIEAYGYPPVNLGGNQYTSTGTLVLNAGAGFEVYDWYHNSNIIVGENGQTYTVKQTGNYSVTVTDQYGCQGSDNVRVDLLVPNYGVTEINLPENNCALSNSEVISIDITNFGTDTLKVGNSFPIKFYINGNQQTSENYVLTEKLAPGKTIKVSFTSRLNLSTVGSYTLKASVDHPLDKVTSNNSFEKTINVLGSPAVDLGGDRVVKTASIVLDAGQGFATYLWNDGSTEQTLTVNNAGVYSVVVTDANGCKGSDEVSLTFIVPDYKISLSNLASSCSLSNAETVRVSITNVGSDTLRMGNTIGLKLKVDGNVVATETLTASKEVKPQQSIDYTFNKKANLSERKKYTISATLEYSLDQNASNNTASVNVEHYKLPVVDLGEDRTCYGSEILDAGSGFVSYRWSDNSTSQKLEVTQSGTYWVAVTDNNGCEGTDEVTLVIKDFSKLTISQVVSPKEKDCKKDKIPVSIIVTNGRGTTIAKNKEIELNYQVNGGSVVSEELELSEAFESGSKITFEFEKGLELGMDSYTIKYWVSYEGALGEPFMQNITINPSPAVNLGDDLDVTFPYTILSGLTGLDFLWSTGATTPTITVGKSGIYWLTATNEFGCEASDTIVLTLTSVHQIPGSGTVVTVYPNPADQWITINVEPRQPALFTVELISQAGQVVYSKNITQNQPFTHRVDVNKFTPGVYLLRVSSGGEWVTVKVVIQR